MIDFSNLDEEELKKNGIVFKNSDDARAFIKIIREDMEQRIGKGMADMLSEEQLHDFERAEDESERREWLKKNALIFREITKKIYEEIDKEIVEYKDYIMEKKKAN